MTKDVMVTISGFQIMEADEQDTIEMVHIGEYYEKNNVQYIRFEEMMEGMSTPVKNMIKIKGGYVEVQKKGPITVRMVFEEGKCQSSTYSMPFGSFLMKTYTTGVHIDYKEDSIKAVVEYTLEMNGKYCAKCKVKIWIQSKKHFRL